MPVVLEGITLPADIHWIDEFAGHGVGQTITPTLTGSLLVEENAQPDGRPMTLDSGGSASWVERVDVEALAALAAAPIEDGETLSLEWADGRTFEVVFDRSRGTGFEASEVLRLAANSHSYDHPYLVKLTLLIKDV